ncbi:MAG: hypothetical protein K0U59_03960 [Gammaproteobacteria bacterium]|nr:hypothetical protein [Gammaproteobacteria bacterium]
MLVIPCKLFQHIQLGGLFTVTPVSMEGDIVELEIVACDGGQLSKSKQSLQLADRARPQTGNENVQPISDSEPSDPPDDGSGSLH